MYADHPYAREVGHAVEAAGLVKVSESMNSSGVMEEHDVSPDVMSSVVYWLQKLPSEKSAVALDMFRSAMQEGAKYCFNAGCEAVGHLKDFKVCPQCKTARYCGDACQKQDWTTGGHKATCGTFASRGGENRAPA